MDMLYTVGLNNNKKHPKAVLIENLTNESNV